MQHLPAVVVVVMILAAITLQSQNNLVSPIKNLTKSQSETASESPEFSTDQAMDKVIEAENKAAEKVPTKTFSKHGNTYTSQSFDDKIVMKGIYKLSTYEVEFLITLPKAGGAISGNLSGTCEGPISGNASSQNQNNTAEISGNYSGKCKPIPTLGFATPMSGDFTGKVFYDEGKAAIIVNNKQPIAPGANYFEMFF